MISSILACVELYVCDLKLKLVHRKNILGKMNMFIVFTESYEEGIKLRVTGLKMIVNRKRVDL